MKNYTSKKIGRTHLALICMCTALFIMSVAVLGTGCSGSSTAQGSQNAAAQDNTVDPEAKKAQEDSAKATSEAAMNNFQTDAKSASESAIAKEPVDTKSATETAIEKDPAAAKAATEPAIEKDQTAAKTESETTAKEKEETPKTATEKKSEPEKKSTSPAKKKSAKDKCVDDIVLRGN